MPLDQVNLTETQTILLAAAAEVRKGWCQGAYQDGRKNVCALGAISRAVCGDALKGILDPTAISATRRVVEHVGIGEGLALWAWNDEPGRTAEEVATALENAAFEAAEI